MRKVTHTKKFFSDAAHLWYLAAALGLMLFCFAPLHPVVPSAGTVQRDDGITEYDSGEDAVSVFLMQGDCGTEVLQLQTYLQALGYDVGDCTGVYDMQTASAVKRFQEDCGFIGDGICSSSVLYAAAYLCDAAESSWESVSEETVWQALEKSGCLAAVSDGTDTKQQLRNALILFQRTHGLYGSGVADYATQCALGIADGSRVLSGDAAAAEAAHFDLRCRLLCDALAEFVGQYPKAYDLYTLTACAAVLCSRAEDVRFPGGFDAVCRMGLLPRGDARGELQSDTYTVSRGDVLLLRAAEDALYASQTDGENTVCRGALYVISADESLPEDAVVCMRTKHFIFYR